MNTLCYGDNLDILWEYIPDESVDLIYLDPPFNSKQAYNVIFKDKDGKFPPSLIEAFDDTWHWGDFELIKRGRNYVVRRETVTRIIEFIRNRLERSYLRKRTRGFRKNGRSDTGKVARR